jgi:peroxiredoxin
MASRKEQKEAHRQERLRQEAEQARRVRARRLRNRVAVVAVAGVAGLGAIFALSTSGQGGTSRAGGDPAGQFQFVVGEPGLDKRAPSLKLASTAGGTWDLAAQRGKTTLLYFQEGLGCQPCWDQIKDIENRWPQMQALGIDQMVSITGNELGQLEQKAADEGFKTPVLADPGLEQSKSWSANAYGMMGDSANGHSFMVVDDEGTIRARADYGGSPNYTMYLPVENLAADLRKQLALPAGPAS